MHLPDCSVSVVIPVYNGETFLAGAIENVLVQDYSPLEIIVVDDGSTDRTAMVAARFLDHVHYIHQSNRGPAAARNAGIDRGSGNVIAFLDVDDWWSPSKLTSQASYLARHPSVEMVQGLIQSMELATSEDPGHLRFEPSGTPYAFINLGSALIRRSVFDRIGLFDEALEFNEDTDWFFRAWENQVSKVVLNEVSLFYRRHGDSMTRQRRPALPNSGLTLLLKKHLDRVREKGLSPRQVTGGWHSLSKYIGWDRLPLEDVEDAEAFNGGR
jgi:glycosyltransferase involved in cell wall biosynthesis